MKAGELSEEKCRVKERFLTFIFIVQEIYLNANEKNPG